MRTVTDPGFGRPCTVLAFLPQDYVAERGVRENGRGTAPRARGRSG